MSNDRRFIPTLLVSAAVAFGLLTWAVTGPSPKPCVAVVLGDHPLTEAQTKELEETFSDGATATGRAFACRTFLYRPLTAPRDEQATRIVKHGPVSGQVVAWHEERGWGVLASPSVEGKVWAHFSSIKADGYRTLTPGQAVTFTYETPGQDGYPHRAISVRAQ